jgi:predicted DNA-binding antitoxin AbrB/MazE fold protein
MTKEIRARFTGGVIEPLEKVDLQEGEEIIITIKNEGGKTPFERAAGGWKDLVDTTALLRDLHESRKIIGPEVSW